MKMQFSDVEVEQRCGEGGMSSFLCLKGGRLVKCMLTLQWSLFHKKQFYQCCWVISNSQVVIKSRRGFNCRKDGIAWRKKNYLSCRRGWNWRQPLLAVAVATRHSVHFVHQYIHCQCCSRSMHSLRHVPPCQPHVHKQNLPILLQVIAAHGS